MTKRKDETKAERVENKAKKYSAHLAAREAYQAAMLALRPRPSDSELERVQKKAQRAALRYDWLKDPAGHNGH